MAIVTTAAFSEGCGEPVAEFREVKGIHEKVSEAELKQFVRIVESLPGKKLPDFPAAYRPLPNWNSQRTLPVNELTKEEQKLLDEAWKVETLARHLEQNRHLTKALSRERISREQFVGLLLAIGAARSRSLLRKDQSLDAVVSRGQEVRSRLLKDDRTFATLGRGARYAVLRLAGWITREDRALLLKEVPPENIALVKQHAESLDKVLPKYFRINPLDAIIDLLEVQGMPFEELAASGRDDEITWGPDDNPIIGGTNSDLQPASRQTPSPPTVRPMTAETN